MVDCYTAAMRILKVRFNSEVELRRKLRAKRFEGADIDTTIERLRTERWLDDERFAGAFVRTRSNKRVGKSRIRRELQAAGVSQDDAKRALAENVNPEKEREGLIALCAKRTRNLVRKHGPDYVNTDVGRASLAGYLVAQGYDSTLVREVVREAGDEDQHPRT